MVVYRGTVLWFSGEQDVHLVEDGALVVDEGGRVERVARWDELTGEQRVNAVQDHRDDLILPGFVDAHAHSGQVDAIASPGGDLMAWLKDYIYPAEARFRDSGYAREASGAFLDMMLAAGTTTACVHTTSFKVSTDAFFTAAEERGLRMVAGKVLMDTGAPEELLDLNVAQAEEECRELIERWHGRGRALYAMTPRFGPTSTVELLRMAGRLYREHDLWMQSHLAETTDEVKQVMQRFADLKPRSYLDVYDQCGMVGPRSVWAHSIWTDGPADWAVLRDKGAGIAFCPTSNLFLGSGLFPLARARRAGVRVGLGTDVGAGTSYSLLATLNEAYKVAALQGDHVTALQGFYLATRGAAEALHLEDRIGGFHPGAEADFVVLDFAATPVLKRRTENADDVHERLFALAMLGDERAVKATYVMGRRAHPR
ncbi:guanine deaminase [Spirillospora sp. CA-253888]